MVSIANWNAPSAGARLTGGGDDAQPMRALAQTAELLEQNPTGFLLGGETVPEYGGRRR